MTSLKDDEELQKLVIELENYCKGKGYNLVLSADDDESEDSIIAYNGTVDAVCTNIVAFTMDYEKICGEKFMQIVHAVLCKCISDKIKKQKLH